MALTNLRGELGQHTLGYNLQVSLPLKLIIKVANLPLSIGVLLVGQVNPCVELP